MVSFPNAKINLGLHIVGKRPDGYHNLQTIFYPIDFKDALEITVSQSTEELSYSQSGITVVGEMESNLCVKAFRLLKTRYPSIPPVNMHLHKIIPMGAGMGGGSADAAFTLILLNKKFNLGIDEDTLMQLSLELGSDCPFFIINKPCVATGRGEIITPIDVSLDRFQILIINPGIHVNTGDAFRELIIKNTHIDLAETIQLPVTEWKDNLTNDFEATVFKKHPSIAALKNTMYELGAVYSSMSGSGSTVYGIFENKINLENKFPSGCFHKWV